jgi:hypothetical protein
MDISKFLKKKKNTTDKSVKSEKPKKGVNPFAKKGKNDKNDKTGEKDEKVKKGKSGKPKKGVNPFPKKKKLNENLLAFVDMMIAENYSNAHKVLEIIINDKLKTRIAEAAKKDLFPKAKDNNPKYLKKQSKKSGK